MPLRKSVASKLTKPYPSLTRLATSILVTLAVAPGVQAEESTDAASAAAQSEQAKEAETLGTVVVTARKREERQIDVPIAMSAVTGAEIQAKGLLSVTDVVNITPGASSIDVGASFTQVQIRGVASSLGGNDNGYYIDETPFSGVTTPWYPDVRSFDIDRVEILKGPQGTLFGEGSMGGTVRIITNKPQFDRFGAGVELGGSTVSDAGNGWGAKAYVNVPLSDKLAARVAVTDESTPGWINDSVTGEKDINGNHIRTGRAKLRFEPTDHWTLDLSYWKSKSHNEAGSNSSYDDMTNDTFVATTDEWDSTSLTSTYDFAESQLVYVYSDGNLTDTGSGDLFPGFTLKYRIDIGVRTHELRWASTGEHRFDWTMGYYHREADRNDNVSAPGILSDATQTNKANALFGETTWKLNSQWALTAGLRYFKDKVDGADISGDGSTSTLNATFESWNPRLSLSYKPLDNTTLYASAAKGFRSGQLQPITSLKLAERYGVKLPSSIAPDTIWTYEIGEKSVLIDDKVFVEGALYYSDWKGVAVKVPITPQVSGLENSGGSKTKGTEFNIIYTPNKHLTLQAGGSYVDATYAEDVPGTPLFKGKQLYNIPKTGLNASASYGWDLGHALYLVTSSLVQHTSARGTATPGGTPGDPITLVGARIALESQSGWSLTLQADNLTNDDGAITGRGATQFDESGMFLRYGAAMHPQPRTFGVVFRYNY